ncbi:hypothetical protein [Arenibacterium halophilum]|uniref:DUF4148 domain-containing protein n=1 Tax=Arenibacterium halophilum TaxID=2583821 RepID=A0ABY2XF38_9RHOB|nr:hypothetical protein [Arenibacterium halophilum]TMV15634.1 hypothetical protein FGK64_06700 [Arenibacterium halophilum]
MNALSRLSVFTLAVVFAAPAFAGDQPAVIKPPYLPVYTTTGVDPVHYRFDTLKGGPVSAPTATATTATGATGNASVARVNAPAGRAQSSDALYAHVLAEAKARGLR